MGGFRVEFILVENRQLGWLVHLVKTFAGRLPGDLFQTCLVGKTPLADPKLIGEIISPWQTELWTRKSKGFCSDCYHCDLEKIDGWMLMQEKQSRDFLDFNFYSQMCTFSTTPTFSVFLRCLLSHLLGPPYWSGKKWL